ncbi:aminodeoxychorismate synthase component I [Thalassotalea algicola]|uniref:aminodeoxychorismate synthase component I n=1 Tax=Thalassotalea algicola TaxID=2716224 RepID=UPI001B7D4EBF
MPTLNAPIPLVAKPLPLPSGLNIQDVFASIADQPWSFWLDSNESKHVDSQFDIIVWQPAVTIETDSQQTKVLVNDKEYQALEGCYQKDPLTLIKEVNQQVFEKVSLPKTSLPFKTGAVGYFSYDLGQHFEKLPDDSKDDINLPHMAVGIYMQAVVYDRANQEVTLIAPENCWQTLSEELTSFIKPSKKRFKLDSNWQSNMSKAAYKRKFEQVQRYLVSGDCYQINLAQRFDAKYQGDEFQAYLKLRQANQAPFSAFMRFSEYSILSISPERFLKLTQSKVQTKPIKGTMPRHNDPIKDKENISLLEQSSKDKAENLMIVDLLRNDISRVCQPGSVKVPKLFDVESFPAVHHLVSTVVGDLNKQYDGTDLLRAAFPGGSITGAPKIRAMEIIEELEPHKRNVYCGSIGYISACGNMDSSITIRTLVCQNDNIYCWAGGGLVADSKVDSEYQETFDKVGKILPILAE